MTSKSLKKCPDSWIPDLQSRMHLAMNYKTILWNSHNSVIATQTPSLEAGNVANMQR